MPSHTFAGGAECWLKVIVCNPDALEWSDQHLFVALEAGGFFWFAPQWTHEPDFYFINCLSGESRYQILLSFQWPENTGTGSAVFWSALLDAHTATIRGDLAQWDFNWNS